MIYEVCRSLEQIPGYLVYIVWRFYTVIFLVKQPIVLPVPPKGIFVRITENSPRFTRDEFMG